MDKWDQLGEDITKAILADEPAAILVAVLKYFGEFGRALELISSDTDRLATAAEGLLECAKETAKD